MHEIEALPWNGYTVASTFSGCGGSCLGYRMAGFKVAWANEFIPAAQATYRANHADTTLDTRDIRLIKPEDVLSALKMEPGELDLFDGSPPCASFSTAGKREAGWGKVKKYSDTQQRTDDLFHEYIRLLRGIQPKTFVAENVSGLVKGTAKGYFLEILGELKASGYRVSCRVLDAQWLGVPQQRQRTIFVGVRDDLGLEPVHPKPLPYRYSVRDALPWIFEVPVLLSGKLPGKQGSGAPSPTITTGGFGGTSDRTVTACVRAIHDTGGTSPNRWAANVDITDRPAPTITIGVNSVNSRHYMIETPRAVEPEAWLGNYATGKEWDKLGANGGQSEKFFQLVKPNADMPSPCVTASGGAPNVASVTHPTERRKFTIAELRRICAFPDDFQLVGTYAQQWERLGRSVPPVMMSAIASTVRDEILAKA